MPRHELTPQEAARIVEEHITYRRGWELQIRTPPEHMDYGPPVLQLAVTFEVEDTYHPGEQRRIQHTQPLSPMALADFESLLRSVREALHRIEMHEADEWLKVRDRNGAAVMPFDPHADRTEQRARMDHITDAHHTGALACPPTTTTRQPSAWSPLPSLSPPAPSSQHPSPA